jgi:hypothetical protein
MITDRQGQRRPVVHLARRRNLLTLHRRNRLALAIRRHPIRHGSLAVHQVAVAILAHLVLIQAQATVVALTLAAAALIRVGNLKAATRHGPRGDGGPSGDLYFGSLKRLRDERRSRSNLQSAYPLQLAGRPCLGPRSR